MGDDEESVEDGRWVRDAAVAASAEVGAKITFAGQEVALESSKDPGLTAAVADVSDAAPSTALLAIAVAANVEQEAFVDSDSVTWMICLEDTPRAQCRCPALSPVERASSSSSSSMPSEDDAGLAGSTSNSTRRTDAASAAAAEAAGAGCGHHACLACVRQWMAEEISSRQPVVRHWGRYCSPCRRPYQRILNPRFLSYY